MSFVHLKGAGALSENTVIILFTLVYGQWGVFGCFKYLSPS